MPNETGFEFVSLNRATDHKHKYYATFFNRETGRYKYVNFGGYGYGDYIYYNQSHGKDYADVRRNAFFARHAMNMDLDNPLSPLFWSTHILWGKRTFQESYNHTIRVLKRLGYFTE